MLWNFSKVISIRVVNQCELLYKNACFCTLNHLSCKLIVLLNHIFVRPCFGRHIWLKGRWRERAIGMMPSFGYKNGLRRTEICWYFHYQQRAKEKTEKIEMFASFTRRNKIVNLVSQFPRQSSTSTSYELYAPDLQNYFQELGHQEDSQYHCARETSLYSQNSSAFLPRWM